MSVTRCVVMKGVCLDSRGTGWVRVRCAANVTSGRRLELMMDYGCAVDERAGLDLRRWVGASLHYQTSFPGGRMARFCGKASALRGASHIPTSRSATHRQRPISFVYLRFAHDFASLRCTDPGSSRLVPTVYSKNASLVVFRTTGVQILAETRSS